MTDAPDSPAPGTTDNASNRSGSMIYLLLICFIATMGGLLFGYDTAVISGAIEFLESRFDLSPVAKGWATSSALAGCVLGCALAGWLSDRLGRKRVLFLSAVFFVVSAIGSAMPERMAALLTFGAFGGADGPPLNVVIGVFAGFRILGGIGVGAASMTSPMYIAEVSPARIRGRMVSLNQLAIVSGILVVFFVNYLIGSYGTELDRRTLAPIVAERGKVVEPQWATDYLDEVGLASGQVDADDPTSMQAFKGRIRDFVSASEPLDTAALAEFLKQIEVNLNETDIQLAWFEVTSWNESRGWQWMFGSEVLPAFALMVLLLLVPESPRWLVKQGRQAEALDVLGRVNGTQVARKEIVAIEEAVALESGSLRQLLQPGMRIVLVIGVALAVLQQVTGINVFLYFGTSIFRGIAREGVDAALLSTVIVGTVNLVFTVVAIWTVDRIGRKPLMLIGFAGMGLSLFAMGIAAYSGNTAVWLLTFILTYIASFALSVGPVTWVILSEIFPTRIRGRAMAIATIFLWSANMVVAQTFPMMDKNKWLISTFNHAFPFWVYGAMCVVAVVFVFVWVPETKQRSLEEIEKHWLGKGQEG